MWNLSHKQLLTIVRRNIYLAIVSTFDCIEFC